MPLIQGNHNGRAAIVTVAIIDAANYKGHKSSDQQILKGAVPFKALIDSRRDEDYDSIPCRISPQPSIGQ
jgi:hypothetical protein